MSCRLDREEPLCKLSPSSCLPQYGVRSWRLRNPSVPSGLLAITESGIGGRRSKSVPCLPSRILAPFGSPTPDFESQTDSPFKGPFGHGYIVIDDMVHVIGLP